MGMSNKAGVLQLTTKSYMVAKNFFLHTVLLLIILTVIKIWFFHYEIFSNSGIQQIVFWLLCAAVAASFVRRFGLISYFEAIFIIIVWTLGGLLLDLLVTGIFTGLSIFSKTEYWAAFALMACVIFVFHKKRHIHIRHELHAKARAAAQEQKH